jgi:hypothetical protein
MLAQPAVPVPDMPRRSQQAKQGADPLATEL